MSRTSARLLGLAKRSKTQLERRLILAAMVTEILGPKMVIVGGTAEEYWTGGEYHPTDLDMTPGPLSRSQQALMRGAGFARVGRHWILEGLDVGVEFPGSGDDIRATVELERAGIKLRMISKEDLYLDRLRQATITPKVKGVEYDSALAVAVANLEDMDWDRVRRQLAEIASEEPWLGPVMAKLHPRVMRDAKRLAF